MLLIHCNKLSVVINCLKHELIPILSLVCIA